MNEMKKMMNPNNNIRKLKIDYKSSIIKENEFDIINLAIKIRLNEEVKELIKLYQLLMVIDLLTFCITQKLHIRMHLYNVFPIFR